MCVALACVGGECVESGLPIDGDGDGYAPFPCGEDCDDRNAGIFPGATELCDGVDQDCDGRIDEGAPGIHSMAIERALASAVIVGMERAYAIVGHDADGALVAMLVGPDRAEGPALMLEPAPAPGDPRRPFGADRDAGELTVVSAGAPGEPPVVHRLMQSGDSLVSIEREPLAAEADVARLDVALIGGQRWIVFDTASGARVLLRETGERILLARGSLPPRLATDGRHVAVTEGDDAVRFFLGSGVEVGMRRLPGPLAARGLASGDGFVYAVYRDAFDHAMTRLTPVSSTSPTTAPFGGREDDVEIFAALPRVLVARRRGDDVRAWLLDATLTRYEAAFTPAEIVARGTLPPTSLSVTTSGAGLTAMLGTQIDASPGFLALLECGR
ncbi:MAG: putative metal-binding motif-containing protein [Sandaracinaceae bacterium]|nr:putative metal-binding motif-containing protein [Sandaracinaceae bacterium]